MCAYTDHSSCQCPRSSAGKLVTWWQRWAVISADKRTSNSRRDGWTHTSNAGTDGRQLLVTSPSPLEIHDSQAAEKWKRFKSAWVNYCLATGLSNKTDAIQVTTLLTVIGEEAPEVFSMFSGWENDGDEAKIRPVLAKFEAYCQPRRNVPFERYCFNRRAQEPGETYDQYRTSLRKITENCTFESITPDEILRETDSFSASGIQRRESDYFERVISPSSELTKSAMLRRAWPLS